MMKFNKGMILRGAVAFVLTFVLVLSASSFLENRFKEGMKNVGHVVALALTATPARANGMTFEERYSAVPAVFYNHPTTEKTVVATEAKLVRTIPIVAPEARKPRAAKLNWGPCSSLPPTNDARPPC